MGDETKQECLEKTRKRYWRAGRKYKRIILDEFCATWGYHRKYAIALLNAGGSKRTDRRGRPARYGKQEHTVLERIWLVANRPCSRRLKAILPVWLPFYEQHHDRLDKEAKKKAIEGGKIKGEIKEGNVVTRIRFTDTTQKLAQFVAAAGDGLFSNEPLRFERVR